MNTSASLDKKIAGYVEQLSTNQKKAVLSVVKAFAEEPSNKHENIWDNEEFVLELDRRSKELEDGTVKGYTWEEVKKMTQSSLSKVKRK